MRFFPTIKYVDEISKDDCENLRNAHLYSNLSGTYNFKTKDIHIKRGEQEIKLLLHELGHWLIAIFTKSLRIHTWYDSFHLKKLRKNNENKKNKHKV